MSVEKVQHRHRWRRKVNGVTCYLPPWCNLSSSAGGWRPTPFAYPSSATFFFSRCSSLRSPSSAILRGLPPPFFLQASSTSVHRAGWRLKVGFLSLAARTYRLDDLASSFHLSLSLPLSLSPGYSRSSSYFRFSCLWAAGGEPVNFRGDRRAVKSSAARETFHPGSRAVVGGLEQSYQPETNNFALLRKNGFLFLVANTTRRISNTRTRMNLNGEKNSRRDATNFLPFAAESRG